MSTPTTATPAVTTTYAVTGMSCGHCESAVTKAVGALVGVQAVAVDVAAGRVTVTTAGEPDDAAVAEAVDDAGYELTGRV
ncbi:MULTISPECIES: cation transporter [Streptomyces]|uniref:cation transporter n=1 Tax=Streptomyces TaxID=1883 RepID=UPI00163D0E19|nr:MULTISPECIES: cation transporter [Streptomyces]MBC2876241.1 cation transporter [Streptomyces sp. TYQ1024]UBI35534.1 cation transporter [Streptomyces mobaraensis]UKW28128.1 cation transporter [Streptomyces sp. TYQ1024]